MLKQKGLDSIPKGTSDWKTFKVNVKYGALNYVDFTNRRKIIATVLIFDISCRSYCGTIISSWAIIKVPGES